MKSIALLLLVFCISSYTSNTSVDTIEVLYDSVPVTKEGIKLEAGKSLKVVNKTSGKVYKVELTVSLGKRPCYQKTYLKEEAMKPILVNSFIGNACADARSILVTVNVSTVIVIPIIRN